jgi:hypothetical protein
LIDFGDLLPEQGLHQYRPLDLNAKHKKRFESGIRRSQGKGVRKMMQRWRTSGREKPLSLELCTLFGICVDFNVCVHSCTAHGKVR